MRLGVELSLDLVTGPARAGHAAPFLLCVRASALDHESLDDPVESRPIVETLFGESLEVLNRFGGDVRPEGHRHFTEGRLEDGLFAGLFVLAHLNWVSISSQKWWMRKRCASCAEAPLVPAISSSTVAAPFALPPPRPRKAIDLSPRRSASPSAATMFPELPLEVIATTRSPGLASPAIWRAKTYSYP